MDGVVKERIEILKNIHKRSEFLTDVRFNTLVFYKGIDTPSPHINAVVYVVTKTSLVRYAWISDKYELCPKLDRIWDDINSGKLASDSHNYKLNLELHDDDVDTWINTKIVKMVVSA